MAINIQSWITPELRPLLTALQHTCRPQPIFLVGGVLRDAYADAARTESPRNWDFALPKDALTIAKQFAAATRGTTVVLDEPLGAVRVIVGHGEQRFEFDLNDYRAPTLDGDLAKRDYTVNAMAVSLDDLLSTPAKPLEQIVHDPQHGRRDLDAGLLRAVYPDTFHDDPLRVLRGPSLAARYGWMIDAPTQALMRAAAPELARVSGERIREEFFKLFDTPRAAAHVRLLDALGIISVVFPESEACRTADQGPFHHVNVWDHSLEALEQLELTLAGDYYPPTIQPSIDCYLAERLAGDRTRKQLLKLIALVHDIGKPATRTVDETGRLWFTGHERLGAKMVEPIAERLKLSSREREALVRQVEAHLRPGFLSREPVITPRAIFRFFRDTQTEGPGVLLVWMADRLATRGRNVPPEEIPRQRAVIEQLLTHYFIRPETAVHPPRLVTGHDLMRELNIPAGPQIGELLEALSEAQVDGQVTTREDALTWARRHVERSTHAS